MLNRRTFLGSGLASAAVAGISTRLAAEGAGFADAPALRPVLARADRMFRVTVCLRPFRAAGPRIEAEWVGAKYVVHNYGHGGSGWSLSWGAAQEAVPLALQLSARDIAVVGAGAIGLTTAITAQRMGATVTIYAKERFPQVRSARATGDWSPDSRIAMEADVAPDFADRWERMARATFATHQSYLGLAGNPIEWTDRYLLSDEAPDAEGRPHRRQHASGEGTKKFLELRDRVRTLTPRWDLQAAGTNPFPAPYAWKSASLTYNVTDLYHHLEAEFQGAGGRFVPTELHAPSDLSKIPEKVILNCTGYGARALFRDESIVPVRGQIAWLIPQPDVNYGVFYRNLSVLGRRDGIVVQPVGENDYFGFNDDNEMPDVAAARQAVEDAAKLFSRA
ncbi:FAD-dependent oxidoreductase [Bradyrhizobium tropiciagri]|uniref:FAD-dependent oxidoreductase n=1 Tax=Bradyrhizobium tropiciagri TaxID=312253 RepID=UPI001BA59DB8|nr:FAD-dependent oxidoreductase [Bradyrhizobium tropiciagri]MBR0895071.1 FAD-dependent oxidoreductase [Bradyrhizobium tropiciagri]